MFRVLNCELEGLQCDWLEEKVFGEYDFYGIGTMEQRRCQRCQTIEYIRFTSEDGYVTEIMFTSDEDFEKLCKDLEDKAVNNG